MKLIERIRARLIDDARYWWRWWSARIMAVGLFLHTWITFDAGSLLWVWKMLPAPLARLMPVELVSAITVALFALAMTMQLTKQKALAARKEKARVAE